MQTYYDPKTQNHDIHSQNTNKPNRPIHEKSPYLLQHANNPEGVIYNAKGSVSSYYNVLGK